MAARINKGFFTKVRVARELLKEQAEEILKEYMEVIRLAREAGEFETAAKHLQWLIEHIPGEEGERIVEQSVDKQQQVIDSGPKGPAIQIGINVGGISKPLPEGQQKPIKAIAEVIDAD